MPQMAGQLDDISEAIGALRASVSAMDRAMTENRRAQDARHAENKIAIATSNRENTSAIEASRNAVQEIKDIVLPLRIAVEAMRPTVEAFALSRSKVAAWASVFLVATTFIGWLVDTAVRVATAWAVSHWH